MSDSLPILEYTRPATSPRFVVEQTDRDATITLPARPDWQAFVIAIGAILILLLLTASFVGGAIALHENPENITLRNLLGCFVVPSGFLGLMILLMRVIFKRQGMQTILTVADGKLTLITPQLLILRRQISLNPGLRCKAKNIMATTLNLQPAGRLLIQRPGRFDLYLLRGMSMRELKLIEQVLNDAISRNCPAMIPDASVVF